MVETSVPVTLVRKRDDVVGPVSEIALKGLQDIGVETFDRLFDEAAMAGLAGARWAGSAYL